MTNIAIIYPIFLMLDWITISWSVVKSSPTVIISYFLKILFFFNSIESITIDYTYEKEKNKNPKITREGDDETIFF